MTQEYPGRFASGPSGDDVDRPNEGATDPSLAVESSGDAPDVAGAARHIAERTGEQASDLKDSVVEQAGQVKDVAASRGADVVDVAKDEIGRVAGEARDQFQTLWHRASSQLRDQADAGRRQLAELLHSLSGELGEMAAKSEQDGPVTALARQASRRGGELSHWLSESGSSDVLAEIRRFARRRPFAFLAGAAVAGVVVGRLSRGLMAGGEDGPASVAPTRATDVTSAPPAVPIGQVPAYGGGTTGQTYGYDVADESGESR